MTHAQEPSVNDLSPVAPGEKEPVVIIDKSGSMSWPVSATSDVERREVVGEAMGILVRNLEDQDSQAAAEQADGSDERGGLLAYLFSDRAVELGDLNSSNWRQKWAAIRWGGGTRVMPAWQLAEQKFTGEFGDDPDRTMLAIVITDGEAEDAAAFEKVLEQANARRKFLIALIGYGPEHDATLRSYQMAERKNPQNVRVVTFTGETDPASIAADLLQLVG